MPQLACSKKDRLEMQWKRFNNSKQMLRLSFVMVLEGPLHPRTWLWVCIVSFSCPLSPAKTPKMANGDLLSPHCFFFPSHLLNHA
jgi:hypothetical protein